MSYILFDYVMKAMFRSVIGIVTNTLPRYCSVLIFGVLHLYIFLFISSGPNRVGKSAKSVKTHLQTEPTVTQHKSVNKKIGGRREREGKASIRPSY